MDMEDPATTVCPRQWIRLDSSVTRTLSISCINLPGPLCISPWTCQIWDKRQQHRHLTSPVLDWRGVWSVIVDFTGPCPCTHARLRHTETHAHMRSHVCILKQSMWKRNTNTIFKTHMWVWKHKCVFQYTRVEQTQSGLQNTTITLKTQMRDMVACGWQQWRSSLRVDLKAAWPPRPPGDHRCPARRVCVRFLPYRCGRRCTRPPNIREKRVNKNSRAHTCTHMHTPFSYKICV